MHASQFMLTSIAHHNWMRAVREQLRSVGVESTFNHSAVFVQH